MLIIIVLPEFSLLMSYCYFLLMFRVSDVCAGFIYLLLYALCFYDYSEF